MAAAHGTRWRWARLVAVALLLLVLYQLAWRMWRQLPEPDAGTSSGIDSAPLAADADRPQQLLPATAPERLTVEVYYEALCPDSRTFVVDQLAPVMNTMSAIIRLVLVPYGKVTTAADGTLKCQHGPTECWGNRVHACGIQQAADQQRAAEFVTCLLKRYRKLSNNVQQCAEGVGLDSQRVRSCADADDILPQMERYGQMTHALRPPVKFIPTIVIDGSQKQQSDMFLQLAQVICAAYQKKTGSRADVC